MSRLRYPQLWTGSVPCIAAWAPSQGFVGPTLPDRSANNNHATLTNMADDWVVSAGKRALRFNGTNDWGSAPLPIGGLFQVTLCAWVNWGTYTGLNRLMFEYTANINTGGNNGFNVNPNSASTLIDIAVSTGGTPYNGGTIPRPPAGEWYHFAATFDRTKGAANNVRAWINGLEQTVTQTLNGNINTAFSSSDLYFACRGGTSLFAMCDMDDIRVYGGILSSKSIALLAIRRGVAYERYRTRSYSLSSGQPTSKRMGGVNFSVNQSIGINRW